MKVQSYFSNITLYRITIVHETNRLHNLVTIINPLHLNLCNIVLYSFNSSLHHETEIWKTAGAKNDCLRFRKLN